MFKSAPIAFVMPLLGVLGGVPASVTGDGVLAGALRDGGFVRQAAEVVSYQVTGDQADPQRVLSYWTHSRMVRAIPSLRPRHDHTSGTNSGDSRRVPGVVSAATDAVGLPPLASAPQPAPNASSTGAVWPAAGAVQRTTGKVFFTMRGRDYVCSASTVASDNKDVVVTAGHCAKDGTGAWADNWVFMPGYHDGKSPYGGFTARRMFVSKRWSGHSDDDYDVAMVALGLARGQHVVDAVGAQSIAFDQPRGRQVYGFGYPATGLYDGEALFYCSGRPHGDPRKLTHDQGLRCDMSQGSSGGPWLSAFDPSRGTGVITSVSSFKYADDSTTMYGPYFGDTVRALHEQAQHS